MFSQLTAGFGIETTVLLVVLVVLGLDVDEEGTL